MDKLIYGAFGCIFGIVGLIALGKLLGVSDLCVYTNSCEYEERIALLQGEVKALNALILEKTNQIDDSARRITELQDGARISIDRAGRILEEIKVGIDPTLDTLTQIERYVRKQQEIQGHVTKILCANNAELRHSGACTGG